MQPNKKKRKDNNIYESNNKKKLIFKLKEKKSYHISANLQKKQCLFLFKNDKRDMYMYQISFKLTLDDYYE